MKNAPPSPDDGGPGDYLKVSCHHQREGGGQMFSNSNSFAAGDVMDRAWETFPWVFRQACPGQAQA